MRCRLEKVIYHITLHNYLYLFEDSAHHIMHWILFFYLIIELLSGIPESKIVLYSAQSFYSSFTLHKYLAPHLSYTSPGFQGLYIFHISYNPTTIFYFACPVKSVSSIAQKNKPHERCQSNSSPLMRFKC